MSVKGTFGWSGKKYSKKISDWSLEELIRHHHIKRARFVALFGGVGAGIGSSLVGSIYALRQMRIVVRKRRLIEAEIVSRGEPIPRDRTRDCLMGVFVGLVTIDIGILAPIFVHWLIGEVVITVAGSAVPLAASVPTPGADLFTGAGHGIHDAFMVQGQAVGADPMINAADLHVVDVSSAIEPGYGLGVHATLGAEEAAGRAIGDAAINQVGDAMVRKM